ncbi:hypothetical protein C0993_008892 [Termitomyces sp. T159_Od127]|nr:hypothetical protein C0993_008892 [Termitomyces sp. T159_Od127]
MTDTDDSIVLDDLVRTGEASRLRRRGAMRLEHYHHHSHPHAILSWDDDDDDSEDYDSEDYIPGLRNIRAQLRAAADHKYRLFCGGAIPFTAESNAFTPSILPLAPPPGPSPPPAPTQPHTTGCGTLLHTAAAPRRRPSSSAHTWHALPGAGASPALVPLDPAYIDDPAALRTNRAPCGCMRDALACAVCGNVLGTRFAPCPVDAHVHAASYTFLPAAVASSPAYAPSAPRPSPRADTASTPPPLVDRFITASPTPLTEEELTAYYRARPMWPSGAGIGYTYPRSSLRNNDGVGVRTATVLDPDAGDTDEDEAAADKTGEGVFLPERLGIKHQKNYKLLDPRCKV